MKAVNLVPSERRRGGMPTGLPTGPAYAVLALLGVALAFVTIYVLTTNTISSRKAKLASLQAETAQAQAQASRLTNYAQFATLAQQRTQTVRQIAATRFNWYEALSDLSKVVPANTSLQSLFASVAPGATVQGSSGGGANGVSSSLRGDLTVPAFELSGCTQSQDDVARLMSRLRLINGVTRVTLGDSQKVDVDGGTSGTSAGGSGTNANCGTNKPTFDIVVFFSALPGAGPNGVQSVGSGSGGSTAGGSTPAGTTSTPAGTTSTTSSATSTPSSTTSTPAASTPATPTGSTG